MKNYPLIFGVFCLIATLSAVLLQPDPMVRFEAEVMILEPEEALAKLDRHASKLAYQDTLKLTHAQLALGAGNLDAARRSFTELLDPQKPLPGILDQLAEVALLENNLVDAAELAQRAQGISPSSERRQKLGYWYRILKDQEAELAVLAASPPEALTAWEVDRLGQLYLNLDNPTAYERLLSALAASDRDDATEFEQKLIAVYLGTDQFEDAATMAFEAFLRTENDLAIVNFTLRGLIEKGAIDTAQGLAFRIVRGHPALGHTVVMPFIRAGHGGIARGLQNAWLSATETLTTDQWLALSSFAETTGDLSSLRQVLSRGSAHGADPVPGVVFLQFVRYGGARSLVPFRSYLTADLMKEAPLVAAAWSSWTKNDSATFAQLLDASRLPMSDWDRAIWMSVADGLRGTAYYSRLMTGAPADAELRRMLRATVLREGATAPDG